MSSSVVQGWSLESSQSFEWCPFQEKSIIVAAAIAAEFSSASSVEAPRWGRHDMSGMSHQIRIREIRDVLSSERAVIVTGSHSRAIDYLAAGKVEQG